MCLYTLLWYFHHEPSVSVRFLVFRPHVQSHFTPLRQYLKVEPEHRAGTNEWINDCVIRDVTRTSYHTPIRFPVARRPFEYQTDPRIVKLFILLSRVYIIHGPESLNRGRHDIG